MIKLSLNHFTKTPTPITSQVAPQALRLSFNHFTKTPLPTHVKYLVRCGWIGLASLLIDEPLKHDTSEQVR